MSRRFLALAPILAVSFIALPAPADGPPPAHVALESIRAADLAKYVEYLASDELEGRDSGSKGATLASDFIAAHFAKHGLTPAGDAGTFFQAFEIGASAGAGPDCSLKAKVAGGEWTASTIEKDYTPFSFSVTNRAAAELVFAGYGITAPDHGWDDYAGLDVKGKIVLVVRHEPRVDEDGKVFDGKRHTRHAYFTTKVARAQELGAAGVVIVSNPKVLEEGDPLFGSTGDRSPAAKIPVVHVKLAVAEAWLASAGIALKDTLAAMDKDLKPASRATGVEVDLAVQIVEEKILARNVVGLLPGTDERLSQELVVIGAHYDHVGRGYYGSSKNARGVIHNGADDNASGTAGLLDVVQAYATAGLPRRRGIVFIAFAGEERGLLGSQHYVDHPSFPLERHVAMLNMDMIGRNTTGELEVNGVGTSPIWRDLTARIGKALGAKAKFGESGYAPSDNTSFYVKKIPVLFFFTGLHVDYHAPSDDADKINAPQMELAARYCFCVAHYLTSVLETRPEVVMAAPTGRGPYLGITVGEGEGPGVPVGGVADDSPAKLGGLLAGDRIVKLDQVEISDIRALTKVLREHKPGDKVALAVKRGEEEVVLTIVLGGRP